MRLNLGCGNKVMQGWTNVDLYDTTPGVLRMDISKLDFADEVADEVLAEMCIEHFPRKQVPGVLREWYRVMKKGAKIKIGTSNLDTMAKTWLDREPGYERMLRGIFGQQVCEGQFHYTGFNDDVLICLLKEVGFKDAYTIKTDHIYHLWVEAIK